MKQPQRTYRDRTNHFTYVQAPATANEAKLAERIDSVKRILEDQEFMTSVVKVKKILHKRKYLPDFYNLSLFRN